MPSGSSVHFTPHGDAATLCTYAGDDAQTAVQRPQWQWEVKWDGYRMLAYVEQGKVELRSRNDKNYTQRFSLIADELAKWKHSAIVDGEMVVLNENGILRASLRLFTSSAR